MHAPRRSISSTTLAIIVIVVVVVAAVGGYAAYLATRHHVTNNYGDNYNNYGNCNDAHNDYNYHAGNVDYVLHLVVNRGQDSAESLHTCVRAVQPALHSLS